MNDFLHSGALLPPHPPCPLLPLWEKGGILGVLMPETEDDTQGLPKKPTPSEKKAPCG
jgi:hypothetical protein